MAGWIGTAPDQADWKGQVRVVQFVRPEIAASIDQLAKVQAVSERFARQGVVFVAVCDARSNRDKMQSVAEDKRIELPIAFDRLAGNDKPSIGATATSLGIKFAPATVVIDRAGKVRAAGLKQTFSIRCSTFVSEPSSASADEASEDEVVEAVATSDKPLVAARPMKARRQRLEVSFIIRSMVFIEILIV